MKKKSLFIFSIASFLTLVSCTSNVVDSSVESKGNTSADSQHSSEAAQSSSSASSSSSLSSDSSVSSVDTSSSSSSVEPEKTVYQMVTDVKDLKAGNTVVFAGKFKDTYYPMVSTVKAQYYISAMTTAPTMQDDGLVEGDFATWKVAKDNGHFTFHDLSANNAGYLNSAVNGTHYNANFSASVSDGSRWDVTIDPTTYAASVKSLSNVYLDFSVYNSKIENNEFCGASSLPDDVYLFQVMREHISATDITLQAEKTTIKVKEKLALNAVTTPEDCDDTIVWSSSDDTIAIVDQTGLVQGVTVGQAVIKAKAGTVEKTISIQVEVGETAATALTLSAPKDAAFETGLDVTLTAAFTPSDTTDKTLTWTSSNPEVATVSDGKVHCVSKGDATITAKTAYEGVEGTLAIHVADYSGYTKVKSASELGLKDQVILAVKNGSGYAALGNTKSGFYVAGTAVSPDAVGVRNPADSVGIYTIEKGNKDNTYAFHCAKGYFRAYQNEKYTNSELSTSINNDTSWTLTDNKDGSFYLQNGSSLWMEYYRNNFTGYNTKSDTDAFKIYIFVKKHQYVPATGISIAEPESKSLEEGSTLQLSATVTPNDTDDEIAWSSLNEDIATVDQKGLVTGVKEGNATIKAKAGSCEATIELTVTKKAVTLSSLEITKDPVKKNYRPGAVFDPTGMEVTGHYSDGTSAIVTDYSYSKDALTAETKKVTISVGDLSVDLPVNVKNYTDTIFDFQNVAANAAPTNTDNFIFTNVKVDKYKEAKFNQPVTAADTGVKTICSLHITGLGEMDQLQINRYAKSAGELKLTFYSGDSAIEANKLSLDLSTSVKDTTYDPKTGYLHTINLPDGITSLYIVNESNTVQNIYAFKVGHLAA